MIVDSHVHVWRQPSDRFPWEPIGKLRPAVQWTVEDQLAAMAQASVDQGVIVQTSWYGYDNRYGQDCLQRYPGRFAYAGMVDPGRPDVEAAMDRLAAQGAGGLRLPALLRPDIAWWGDSAADRMWRKAGDLHWVLCLLVRPEQAVAAAATIERFPDVAVVIDHLAHPDLEEPMDGPLFAALLAMARLPNVYLKVSAFPAISHSSYPFADVSEFVRRAFDAYGPQRVMWGTDHAMTQLICAFSLQQSLAFLDCVLARESAADRAWVKGGAAARLWRLDVRP